MAEGAVDLEALTCSICLDLLKDPVTIPCGHSYCRICIQNHWDHETYKQTCPQCRQNFRPRPALVKNIVLAGLVEQVKTRPIAPPAVHHSAGPGDVCCDSCVESKQRAVKSCLQCMASFCETHIKPHYKAAVFQTHQLVAPSNKLQENICSQHNEVKKMFCRTDQQSLCVVCCMDQHKGHDTVSTAVERSERQGALERSRAQLLQSIQDKETDFQKLQQEAEDLRHSAQDALQQSGERFTHMALLLEVRRSEVEQQIRSELTTKEKEIQKHQEELQQNITEINKTISEIDTLSLTEDHSQFIQDCPPLFSIQAPEGPRVHTGPSRYFEKVTTAVSALTDQLQLSLNQGMTNISSALTQPTKPPPPPLRAVSSSRQQGLRYSQEITLDPNTAQIYVSLSEGNRRATVISIFHNIPDHPDRFNECQVLSSEALTGRCYWEVECKVAQCIRIAVCYKSINRSDSNDEARFGNNDKSWALEVGNNSYSFWFNNVKTEISGPMSSRIGVYVDHRAGVLSFYSVKGETMIRLRKVTTTFTEPIYAGIRFYHSEDTATFLKLK